MRTGRSVEKDPKAGAGEPTVAPAHRKRSNPSRVCAGRFCCKHHTSKQAGLTFRRSFPCRLPEKKFAGSTTATTPSRKEQAGPWGCASAAG